MKQAIQLLLALSESFEAPSLFSRRHSYQALHLLEQLGPITQISLKHLAPPLRKKQKIQDQVLLQILHQLRSSSQARTWQKPVGIFNPILRKPSL